MDAFKVIKVNPGDRHIGDRYIPEEGDIFTIYDRYAKTKVVAILVKDGCDKCCFSAKDCTGMLQNICGINWAFRDMSEVLENL